MLQDHDRYGWHTHRALNHYLVGRIQADNGSSGTEEYEHPAIDNDGRLTPSSSQLAGWLAGRSTDVPARTNEESSTSMDHASQPFRSRHESNTRMMFHAGSAISLGRRFLHHAREKLLGQTLHCTARLPLSTRITLYMLGDVCRAKGDVPPRTTHAVIRKNGGLRCWAHSSSSSGKNYAPPVVTAHVDMIRRHADSFPDEFRPNNDLDHHLDNTDVQSALGSFESVTGVKGEDA